MSSSLAVVMLPPAKFMLPLHLPNLWLIPRGYIGICYVGGNEEENAGWCRIKEGRQYDISIWLAFLGLSLVSLALILALLLRQSQSGWSGWVTVSKSAALI